MDFNVNLPYPPIKVEKQSITNANLILLNYAGAVSEFSAINQYTFHELSFCDSNKEVSSTIKGIAKVEMIHMQMLGELIVKLGSDPGYWINTKKKRSLWNANFINYSTDLQIALETDMKSEKEAIVQYKRTINSVDDQNIKKILNRIILDEEYHIQLLTNLYTEYILR